MADIIGTVVKDVLTGTAGSDILTGLAGNDTLKGGNGDDIAVDAGVFYGVEEPCSDLG